MSDEARHPYDDGKPGRNFTRRKAGTFHNWLPGDPPPSTWVGSVHLGKSPLGGMKKKPSEVKPQRETP